MRTQAPKSPEVVETRATFVVPTEKLDRYREIVKREHRTVSQALRLHIDETIRKADAPRSIRWPDGSDGGWRDPESGGAA